MYYNRVLKNEEYRFFIMPKQLKFKTVKIYSFGVNIIEHIDDMMIIL